MHALDMSFQVGSTEGSVGTQATGLHFHPIVDCILVVLKIALAAAGIFTLVTPVASDLIMDCTDVNPE